MTIPMHWGDIRHQAKVATPARVRQTALRALGVLLVMAGIAALMVAIMAFRVYAFVPALN